MTHGDRALPPERVCSVEDARSGLRGVIVIHSTALGPAAGGCRFWTYDSPDAATEDAMRLAEGMAYKNAVAGLPLGGGKAVLRMPEPPFSRGELFAAFGRAVQALDGEYVTAEDVGTSVEDMEAVARETRHVAGLPPREGRPGGDPSPWTARGVFEAMRVAARARLGRELSDCTVAVQGLGHVGAGLTRLLHAAGARLIVADPKPGIAAKVAVECDAEIMSKDAIVDARADIFAPCALGGVLNRQSVSRLHARLVCGAANNQLADESVAALLADRDILYAPDYVVNAGGIISVAAEYLGWEADAVQRRVGETGMRLQRVFDEAERSGRTPADAADTLARRIIAQGGADAAVAA
nr:Glu/Leu/Phe/Val dehydrogenase dimerization domain-containing protein [Sphingosinithalassobacter tenebrarum]